MVEPKPIPILGLVLVSVFISGSVLMVEPKPIPIPI